MCEGEPAVETIGTLSRGRFAAAGAPLADGRVLVAGGWDAQDDVLRSTDLVDPATGAVETVGGLGTARNFLVPVVRGDGSVLVVGGFNSNTGSVVDAAVYAGGWTHAAPLREGREAHTASLLPDGRVIVAGGLQAAGFDFYDSTEEHDGPAGPAMSVPRAFHVAAVVGGRLLLAGGDTGSGETDTLEWWGGEVLDARLAHPSKALAIAPFEAGWILAGGANTDGTLEDAAYFDGEALTALPDMPSAHMAFTLTPLEDGRVLAAGGWGGARTSGALEVWDGAAWATLPLTLARSRHDHVAIPLGGCRVLIAGGLEVIDGVSSTPTEVEVVSVGG